MVAHNIRFDVRKSTARFLIHKLQPPSPYRTFCTLAAARRVASFDSNKLDDLAVALGLGVRKIKHAGFSLWRETMAGDSKAWRDLKSYNARDVTLLRLAYEQLRAYTPNHPPLNWWRRDLLCCPSCQSTRIQLRGFTTLKTGHKQRLRCEACGTWSVTGPLLREGVA